MNEFLIKLLGEEVLKQLVIILSADFEVLLSIYLFNIKVTIRRSGGFGISLLFFHSYFYLFLLHI